MTRIRDLSTFNAVRSAGLAKLQPVAAAHRRRHGHLRDRQRRRGRLCSASPTPSPNAAWTCISSAPAASAFAPRSRWSMFGSPGQPLVILHRVQTDHVNADSRRVGGEDGSGAACSVQDRGVGSHHGADALRRRLSGHSGVERGSVLPRPEEDRPAQLRTDQSGRHRGIHRDRRLSVAVQGADRRHAGAGQRADQDFEAARPRRRRLLDRPEMGVPAQGGGGSQIPDLQRRRRRPRRLHEPQRNRGRSAFADRGHGDRRLHHRRQRKASSMSAPNIRWPSTG